MSFESTDPQILDGIKILRQRIKIPSSKLDETINIASWNIREFGKISRTDAAVNYIAEIISNFDLVAIVELRENLSDLKRVMDILGPYWRVIFSDTIMDAAGNHERIGYLYDTRAMSFTGLAAEADPFRKLNKETGEYTSEVTWWRSPYIASFRAGKFDFVLITAHIRWDLEKNRIKPLVMLAEWIDKRRKSKYEDKDVILMGDFNIPDRDSDLFKAITSKGLEIPNTLLGAPGTNLAKNMRYDQILWYRKYKKDKSDNAIAGGAADYYADDWRVLFPQEKYPDMTQEKFTFQLSDHLPLWIQIDTADDAKLDQIIQENLDK